VKNKKLDDILEELKLLISKKSRIGYREYQKAFNKTLVKESVFFAKEDGKLQMSDAALNRPFTI
jgi:hypothetical protein